MTVVGAVKAAKQPRGGYLPVKSFRASDIGLPESLSGPVDINLENVHSSLVGLAVDYLTRFCLTGDFLHAFDIPLKGAKIASQCGDKGALAFCDKIMDNFLRPRCSLNARAMLSLFLAQYDVWYRQGHGGYRPMPNPTDETIAHVEIMVRRTLEFFKQYGPVVSDHLVFPGGYTAKIQAGDGDYMTGDCIWDMKVSVRPPTSKHTLQILLYWLLGVNSIDPAYRMVEKLGLFNPRLGTVYQVDICDLRSDMIRTVGIDIAGMTERQVSVACGFVNY